MWSLRGKKYLPCLHCTEICLSPEIGKSLRLRNYNSKWGHCVSKTENDALCNSRFRFFLWLGAIIALTGALIIFLWLGQCIVLMQYCTFKFFDLVPRYQECRNTDLINSAKGHKTRAKCSPHPSFISLIPSPHYWHKHCQARGIWDWKRFCMTP